MTLVFEQLPREVEAALQKKAESEGKTVEEVAVEALARGLGVNGAASPRRDLSDIVGTMTAEDAQALEETVREQDEADLRLRREEEKKERNLSKYRGKWIEDPAVDEALRSFDEVDEDLWK